MLDMKINNLKEIKMKTDTIPITRTLKRYIYIIYVLLFALMIKPTVGFSQTTINLGRASNFAILAAAGITNTGSTSLFGDIGSYPTNTINGFPPGIITGINHGGDVTTQGGMIDLNLAYLDAEGRTGDVIPTELSGLTLTAGIYKATAGFGIAGTLILNGEGNPNAVFIFQMSSTLITASNSSVNLINEARWENIFWQVGSSATLGVSSIFEGSILSNTSITVMNSATVHGRLLAGAVVVSGAVTIDNSTALPVELMSFTAVLNNGVVKLNWNTAIEKNNYGFEIQRNQTSNIKNDPQNSKWIKIGFVDGAGNSNSPKFYSFVDNVISSGSYSYRLKQIDNDGNFVYSDVVEVKTGLITSGFLLNQNYPNPFNPTTQIQFNVSKNTYATLTIFNVIGQKVATLYNGNALAGQPYNLTFNGTDQATGIFYYKLQTNEKTEVKKMLLLK